MFIFKKRTRNKPKTEARGPSFQSLMFWAGITAGLCGTVFGLWEMKLNRALTTDNNSLMERRLEFIDHIKRRNREIMLLRNVVDSMQQSPKKQYPKNSFYPEIPHLSTTDTDGQLTVCLFLLTMEP